MATAMTVVTARRRPRSSTGTLVAEVLASLVLGLFGYWAIFSGGNAPWERTDAALAFGIGLCVVALLFVRYDVHANPLISVGAWMAHMTTGFDAALRSCAQLVGFVFAVLLMWWQHGHKAASALFGTPVPAAGILWLTTLLVGVLTGLLFVLVALYAIDRQGVVVGAITLGLALFVAVYFSMPFTGGGVNTARNIASMLFSGYWPLWGTLGELIGAALAGLVYRRLD